MSSLFRTDIQGLRAIAVLMVIIFHYDENLLPSGFIGVDVFFVISGYLITLMLIALKSSELGVKDKAVNFYISRFKRIVPAYMFLLVVVALIAATILIESDFKVFSRSLRSSFWFASNSYFASYGGYFDPSVIEQPLLHTWSLAIEMQFYFIYPLFFLFIPIKFLRHLVLTVLILLVVYCQQVTDDSNSSVYYDLFARLPAFLIGALPALYAIKLDGKYKDFSYVAGFIFMIAAIYLIDKEVVYPGFYSLLPSVAAMLVIVSSGARLSKWLGEPLLVWLGALSYSLYLWH